MFNSVPIIISSPSGAGKTTLREACLLLYPNTLEKVITTTTRSPRGNEKNNIDYIFLTRNDFNEKVEKNEFIEYTEVHGNMYGCLRSSVDYILQNNKFPVIILDVIGKQKFDPLYPDSISIFIYPPKLHILETRIRSRNTSEEDIKARLSIVEKEISIAESSGTYNYYFYNDKDLEESTIEFCNLIETAIKEHTEKPKIAMLKEILSVCSEVELFLFIDGVTFKLKQIDKELTDGEIEFSETVESEHTEIKKSLFLAIEFTKKFNIVNPFTSHSENGNDGEYVTPSEEYNNWYSSWLKWKNSLTPQMWWEIDTALNNDEIPPYLPNTPFT